MSRALFHRGPAAVAAVLALVVGSALQPTRAIGEELRLASGVGAAPPVSTGVPDVASERFQHILLGFPQADSGYPLAVLLGLREPGGWSAKLKLLFSPRILNQRRLEAELLAEIALLYDPVPDAKLDTYLTPLADGLLDFEGESALSAQAVADLNLSFESHYVFAGSIRPDAEGECGIGDFYKVELRRMAGASPSQVRILSNSGCVESGLPTDMQWNRQAAVAWGAVALILLGSMLRGHGTVVVRVKLPADSRADLAVGVTRRPRKLEHRTAQGSDSGGVRFQGRLSRKGFFEKRHRPGQDIVFRWLTARSAPYCVTLRGPIFHAGSDKMIGDFLEENTVVVERGSRKTVVFDLCPKQCAVEVAVFRGAQPVNRAHVSVRGARTPVRHTADGKCFLYLDQGSHVLLIGAADRAAEREITLRSLEPVGVSVDLAQETGLFFQSCPDAVAPFVAGRFGEAITALESAGEVAAAHRVRGTEHLVAGRVQDAAFEFEAAGDVQRAELVRGADSDEETSAETLEGRGEFGRAAQIWKRLGNVARAAAAFEQAKDASSAIECYQKIGDLEKAMVLLEESQRYFEAGKLAFDEGQIERAVHDLGRVDDTHVHYVEACALLGAAHFGKQDMEIGVAKFDEALRLGGPQQLPRECLEAYGARLEAANRIEDALLVYGALRENDLNHANVNTRIESLHKKRAQQDPKQPQTAAASPAPQRASDAAPEPTESRYEIIQELGRGAMGVVYQARDTYLGRIVALKHLVDSLRDHPNAVKFFEREARSAAVLNHPNIVTVYDAGQENGTYFICMEFLEGTPFDAIVKSRGPLDASIAASLGLQVAAGLHYAHKNKIIHRDIKTANLFLTQEKVVKIMDFGLAKMVEEVRRSATIIGGTPYYMPPEQTLGEAVDHRADLYALGVTLFQLLTASYPFAKGDMAYHHCHTPAPDVREFIATVPQEMAELILELMAKKPEDRVQSAGEVGTRLQAILDALRVAGPRAS